MKPTNDLTAEEMNKVRFLQKRFETLSRFMDQIKNMSTIILDGDCNAGSNTKIGYNIEVKIEVNPDGVDEVLHVSDVLNLCLSAMEKKTDGYAKEIDTIFNDKKRINYKPRKFRK